MKVVEEMFREAVASGKDVVLDLYCCQGGATKGYQDEGAYVIGVDLAGHRRYCGDAFVAVDAVSFLVEYRGLIREHVRFIHASPPCQLYSATHRIHLNDHPDLIGPTRTAMAATGVPGVIENVEDARSEMIEPVMLCGAEFGLHTYRHRLFETVGWKMDQPVHKPHRHKTVKMGRPIRDGDWYHAVGNFSGVAYVKRDMGVGWMNRDGIRECIPPAYAQYVFQQFKK